MDEHWASCRDGFQSRPVACNGRACVINGTHAPCNGPPHFRKGGFTGCNGRHAARNDNHEVCNDSSTGCNGTFTGCNGTFTGAHGPLLGAQRLPADGWPTGMERRGSPPRDALREGQHLWP
jgi:hypothetical protein